MMKWSKWMLVSGVLAFSANAYAVPPTPEMLTFGCLGCHGGNGSSGPSMPTLANQSKEAIVDAMKKFKSGERPATVMGRVAKAYTDDEIALMGDFFSKQKFFPTTQALKKANVKKGAELAKKNCSRCHLENGKEGKDDAPVMASQWLPYMQIQMELYTTDKRKMPEKMADKVKNLSKEELDAILTFYANVK